MNTLDQARLGLAVSRKTSPHAVVRNRLKRVIREVFRQQRHSLDALDFIVITHPQAALVPNTELARATAQLLQKLSRTCVKS